MGLKRKWSADISPLSISSYGDATTPEMHSPVPFPIDVHNATSMESSPQHTLPWTFHSAGRTKGSDWGCRTRKRMRNNRPNEHIVYQNTLNKLFSAQRKHPNAEPILSESLLVQSVSTPQKPQKSTLHSFWKPPASLDKPALSLLLSQPSDDPLCPECDALLQDAVIGMDLGMDIDGPAGQTKSACHKCRVGHHVS